MATAMVALTFGLARWMLDKAISTYVILIGVLAVDLGLLVLVAQKKSDIFRILRAIVFTLICVFGFAALLILAELPHIHSVWPLAVVVSIVIAMILLLVAFNLLVKKADIKEGRKDAEAGDSPFRQDQSHE
jgi:cytochrome c oxidase subunit IV